VKTFPRKKVLIALIVIMAIVAGVALYLGSAKNDPTTTTTTTTTTPAAAPPILTIAVNGGGTTSPELGRFRKAEYEYSEDEVVTITAIANSGWQFDGWDGDVAEPNSATTTVTMTSNKTATAKFSTIPFVTGYVTLEMNTLPIWSDEGGRTNPKVLIVIEGGPNIGTYPYATGTIVPITAIPDNGWQFDGWTGDIDTIADASSSTTTITMDSMKSIMANFSKIPRS
jgi:uncharacterized repeat protein (TIGR02543 family)